MNNTFEFGRFFKLLSIDLKRMESKYGLSILVFAAGYFAFWVAMSILGDAVSFGSRHIIISVFLWFCLFMAPSKIYGFANDKIQGLTFGSLPASTLEKWLSMLLICLLFVPLQAYVILLMTDLVLSILPFGAFQTSIFSAESHYVDAFFGYMSDFFQVFAVIAFAMFGNLLFKKHKGTKTFLILFVSYIILLRVYVFVLKEMGTIDGIFTFTASFGAEDVATLKPYEQKDFILSHLPEETLNFVYLIVDYVRVLTYTLFAGSLIGSYLKIKTLKY